MKALFALRAQRLDLGGAEAYEELTAANDALRRLPIQIPDSVEAPVCASPRVPFPRLEASSADASLPRLSGRRRTMVYADEEGEEEALETSGKGQKKKSKTGPKRSPAAPRRRVTTRPRVSPMDSSMVMRMPLVTVVGEVAPGDVSVETKHVVDGAQDDLVPEIIVTFRGVSVHLAFP
jgi:hypothetical protein